VRANDRAYTEKARTTFKGGKGGTNKRFRKIVLDSFTNHRIVASLSGTVMVESM